MIGETTEHIAVAAHLRCRRFARYILCGLVFLISGFALAGEVLLADAVQKQDGELVRQLMAAKTDVNAAQADGMTALHWAAYLDDLEAAKLLVEAGAKVSATNRYGVAPLSLACLNGDGEMVSLFLKAGADPNITQRGGESVLMTAARTGRPESVDALLTAGADPNAKDRRGQTAMMWAAADGHAAVVELLITAGADYKTPLESGFTPFYFAVREGRSEVARQFLRLGMEVNAVMQSRRSGGRGVRPGTSALILAMENGHFELAAELLAAGADANDNRTGFTPLHTITRVRKPNRGDGDDDLPPPKGSGTMGSLEFVRTLVKHGADVNAKLKRDKTGRGQLGKDGATPFFLAADTADLPLMQLLVELGADPLERNADGATPLMAAAGLGTQAPGEEAGTDEEAYAAVQLMLALGDDINAVDQNGETAMHGAAYKSAPTVVQLLAESGAKVEKWFHKNKWGWTPLSIAEGYRPGNFRPSADTLAALHGVMMEAGVTPPEPELKKVTAGVSEYPAP